MNRRSLFAYFPLAVLAGCKEDEAEVTVEKPPEPTSTKEVLIEEELSLTNAIPLATCLEHRAIGSCDWSRDAGVSGMTRVDQNPKPGQYRVAQEGNYQFNAADAGKTVTITYAVLR